MAVQRDSYERLDAKNIVVSDLLSWHFEDIVGEIHRKYLDAKSSEIRGLSQLPEKIIGQYI